MDTVLSVKGFVQGDKITVWAFKWIVKLQYSGVAGGGEGGVHVGSYAPSPLTSAPFKLPGLNC